MKRFACVLIAAAAVLVCAVTAAADGIDREKAAELAVGFVGEIARVEADPLSNELDISPYTSVEKFAEYISLRMSWVRELAEIRGVGGDPVDFEAEATDFRDVDGGLLVTVHTKETFHYSDGDGISENSVYVLVAEGVSDLEVRDYNNPHTVWDGIRGDSYVPEDVDYWIDSPDIEAALQNVRDVTAAGVKIYSDEQSASEASAETSPDTGIAFPAFTAVLAAAASGIKRS